MAGPRGKNDGPSTAEDVADERVDSPGDAEVSFTVEQLLGEHSEALGTVSGVRVTPAVVAGALHGSKPTDSVSIKDAKDRVRKWLKAPDSTVGE